MKNSKTLTALVKQEAKNLKKFATKKELNKLNIGRFDADAEYGCIYGQMTGHCHSDRAKELIEKCAPRIMFGRLRQTEINGKPKELTDRSSWNCKHWSPIEVFVIDNTDESAKLISYLKSETKTLSI